MVDHLFRNQHGLITRAQALEAGMTKRQIGYRLETGAWLPSDIGVYRHAAVAPTWESQLLTACLASGGLASHRSAAALWRVEGFNRPKPEIIVPSSTWYRRRGVNVHTTTQWDRIEATEKRSIPVTGVNRTVLDCGAVVGVNRLERIAESVLRRELTDWDGLLHTLVRHSRQGRDGCGVLRSLLEWRYGDADIALSDFGRQIAQFLVGRGLPEPEVEYRVHDSAGNFIMQADLAWPRIKKAWEVDGLAYHFGRRAAERDRRKRNEAKAHGWNIQEVLWSMYIKEPAELERTARLFLREIL